MRRLTVLFWLAIVLLTASSVRAQYLRERPDLTASRDAGYATTFEEDDAPQDSPSDRPRAGWDDPVPPPPGSVRRRPSTSQYDDSDSLDGRDGCDACSTCGRASCCGCETPHEQCFKLYDNPCSGVRIGGWVDMSTTYNGRSGIRNPADGRGNLPVTFNYRDGEFQLQQAYGYIEKSLDDCRCGWQAGGRIDALFGEDYIFTQAAGLELRPNGDAHWNHGVFSGHNGIRGTSRNGLALPQAYAELGYNDLRVKVGHFYTIIGYESVMAPQNFFLSHAYTMQYGEPFTHSGVLATWDRGCGWAWHAGVVNGWDKLDAVVDKASFLGGVTWTSCDERTTLAVSAIVGQEDGTDEFAPPSDRTMYSVVLQHQINDCWTYVIQHDNGWQDAQSRTLDKFRWYGINQYLFYTLNCCWSAGVRYEWFNDQHGTRVDTLDGHYHEITAGLNYKPNGNVVVRPELRWDWYDAHSGVLQAFGPFSAHGDLRNRRSQFLAAVDLIVLF